jgi:hypothetical protein
MTLQDKRTQMTAMVEQWRQSGLSQAGYAQVQNIKLAKLHYWIHRQRQDESHRSGFIQLNGLPSSGISIRYPNGVELVLPAQVTAGYLKMLISF